MRSSPVSLSFVYAEYRKRDWRDVSNARRRRFITILNSVIIVEVLLLLLVLGLTVSRLGHKSCQEHCLDAYHHLSKV